MTGSRLWAHGRTAILVVALLVAGCNASGEPAPGAVAPIDQVTAWTRSPNFTTCDQWATEMTESQRIVMAGDLLPIFRKTVDTAASAGAELNAEFAAAIGRTCKTPEVVALGKYVITAAATLAFMGDPRFQP
jgi:hypothetical protein